MVMNECLWRKCICDLHMYLVVCMCMYMCMDILGFIRVYVHLPTHLSACLSVCRCRTRALLGLHANEIHLCGGMESLEVVRRIIESTGDSFEVKTYQRLSPLK